jgi:hypothetical protein
MDDTSRRTPAGRGASKAGREAHLRSRRLPRRSIFNSSLEGNTGRAIELGEGEKINDAAFRQLAPQWPPTLRRAFNG